MNSQVLAASPTFDVRTPVVILSRKVVRDFLQHNILPENVQMGANMTESGKKTPKRNRNINGHSDKQLDEIDFTKMKLDANIRDSGNMQPWIILDRASVEQALTELRALDTAKPLTNGKKKKVVASKSKPAMKKPTKAGRPQFVLPSTRSKNK